MEAIGRAARHGAPLRNVAADPASGHSGEPGNLITSLIREIFELRRRCNCSMPSRATRYRSGECLPEAEQQTRDAYFLGADTFDPQTESWYCVLRLGTRPVGGLALNGTEMTKLAATALASLSGIALERARALQKRVPRAGGAPDRTIAHRRSRRTGTRIQDAPDGSPHSQFRASGRRRFVRAANGPGHCDRPTGQQAGSSGVAPADGSAGWIATEFKPQREPVLLFRSGELLPSGDSSQETDRARFQVSVPKPRDPRFCGPGIDPDVACPACR